MPTATPKGYTDISQIEDYLLIDIENYFEPRVQHWIVAVETMIEQITGRVFKADTSSSVRYFDGGSAGALMIDDAVEITSIKLGRSADSTEYLPVGNGTDYYLYPANGSMVNRIELARAYYPSGTQNIGIGAKWGYSVTPPEDIQLAATIIAAGIINFNAPETGERIQSETIGRYSVTYRDEQGFKDFEMAKGILESYRKMTV